MEELATRPNAHNDINDAMRHAEWMRRTTQETNSFTAWIAGTGHEVQGTLQGQPLTEMLMDLHNNSVGRSAGRNNQSVDLGSLWTLPRASSQYEPYQDTYGASVRGLLQSISQNMASGVIDNPSSLNSSNADVSSTNSGLNGGKNSK